MLCLQPVAAEEVPGVAAAKPAFDAALAQQLGADAQGMRRYVLVILKTGPKPMPKGPARDAMFKGHFANIQRLADAGQLAVAGPFMGGGDWRGLFVLAVADVEAARALVETDPVVTEGEMVAEYHPWYSSAALMQVPSVHQRLSAP
jgi:uncharacterized protein YciI